MDSIRIDSFLHNLDRMQENLIHEDYRLQILKVELRRLKTFLLCARIYKDGVSLESLLFQLRDAVNKKEKDFHSLCLRLEEENGLFSAVDVHSVVDSSLERIKSFNEEIRESWATLVETYAPLSESESSTPSDYTFQAPRDQLMEFVDSLLVNLVDILSRDDVEDDVSRDQIEVVKEKLALQKNFIRLVELRGFEHRQLESLLFILQAASVIAAAMSYVYGFRSTNYNQDEETDTIKSQFYQLQEVIELHDSESYETYQVLAGSILPGLSQTLTLETNKHILGDFVDSLLFLIWEAIMHGTSYIITSKDQMPILYEALRFLRIILKKHVEEVDELHEKVKDLIGFVVYEAGGIIFMLLMWGLKEDSTEAMDVIILELLGKIKLIKVVTSTLIFPRTDELGFMDFLLENLNELPSCNVDSIAFVKDQIQTVQKDLTSLRSLLEKILDQHNQHEKLQALWNRVIEVAYKIQFAIQSLVAGDILDSSLKIFNPITEEIDLIKIEALKIGDNKYSPKVQKARRTSNPLPSVGGIATTDKVVVILHDETKNISDQLTAGPKQLDIVSIVGMPGLGKTTLATTVYNDPSVRDLFHIRAWCVVSQLYEKKDLLLQILGCIVTSLSDQYSKMSEDDLEEELRRRLMRNRYFIVLDDVWDSEAWKGLERSFPNDFNGSRILLTSRHHHVAEEINPNRRPHSLRQLSEDESWELLQKKLSHKKGYPLELGMQIAKCCKGLPLTVVIVAGILANLEQDGWKEIADRLSLSSLSVTEQCMDILQLSYGHLPNYLKSCLLYFGAFPEDQGIPFWKLMRLWIAEGFVQNNEAKSLEDVAKDYMNDLIGRSLVMVSKERSVGGVKTCRIHDLLHEFCLLKAKKENFLSLLSGYDELFTFYGQRNLQRVFVYSHREHFEKSRLFCLGARSLLFFAQGKGYDSRHYSFSFIFRIFKLLKVLDLSKINLGNSFPSEISVLVELRYLAIRARLEFIPSSIINLSNLETLLVDTIGSVVQLPDTIWNMQKLRHLHVNGRFLDFSLAYGILGRSFVLHNLDYFSLLRLPLGLNVEKIMRKFPNIRTLKCALFDPRELDGNWYRIVEMDFLNRLESLKLILLEKVKYDMEFQFPLNLKKLTLAYFDSSIIPKSGKLPNLEVLKLSHIHYEGDTWDMEEEWEFPKLKILKLQYLELVKWIGSSDHFPLLEKLVLQNCQKLEQVPSCLEDISNLQMIEVRWCSDSVASLLQEIEEEQKSFGNEDLNLLIFRE